MKKSFVVLLVFFSLSLILLHAQVNGDNDTIWTKLISQVDEIKFSPRNDYILCLHRSTSSPAGNRTWIFDIENGDFLKQIDSTYSLLIDSVNNRIFTSCLKKIYAWDIGTYEKYDYFEPAEKDIQQPTYSPKNNRLAAVIGYPHYAQYEGVIKVWDCLTGKIILTKNYGYFNNPETGHSFPPGFINIKFNDGLNIMSIFVQYGDYRDENDPYGSSYISKEIFEVYDASTFALKSNDTILGNYFYMSESGKYLVEFERQSDGKDDMIIFQTSDFNVIARIPVYNRDNVYDIVISKDDKYLIFCNGNKTTVYDINLNKEIYSYKGAQALDIINDNTKLVTYGYGLKLYHTPWYTSVPHENELNAYISFPNPAEKVLNLSFSLNRPENTIIDIIDLNGKTVSVLFNGLLTEGNHELSFNIESIPSGAYILKINSGQSSFSQKIIISN